MAGTTSAANVLQRYQGRIQLKELPDFSDCVAGAGRQRGRRGDHRRRHPGRFAAEPQYQGKLKVVGKGFSDESYGVGIKKGNTALVDQVNAALKQYIADGSWQRRWASPSRPSGYQIPDPPTPGSA